MILHPIDFRSRKFQFNFNIFSQKLKKKNQHFNDYLKYLLVEMFDWATDFDLSAFENGGFPADFQSDFLFRLTLLDEILIGRLNFGQIDRLWRKWRPLWYAADSCCCYTSNFELLLLFVAFFVHLSVVIHFAATARLARIARLRFGRPRRRIAVIGRLCQHLTQGQHLLAGNFSNLKTSVARRRALHSQTKQSCQVPK